MILGSFCGFWRGLVGLAQARTVALEFGRVRHLWGFVLVLGGFRSGFLTSLWLIALRLLVLCL